MSVTNHQAAKSSEHEVIFETHANMLVSHWNYSNLSTANLPWSAMRAGSSNNSSSILTDERTSVVALMLFYTLCTHENEKEKILSGYEWLWIGPGSLTLEACWVTSGWNLSEFQISTSPLSKSTFVLLFTLHGTPISTVWLLLMYLTESSSPFKNMAFLVARCSQAPDGNDGSTADEHRKRYFQSCLLHCGEAGAPKQPLQYLLLTETNQLRLSSPTYPKTDRGLDGVAQTNNDLIPHQNTGNQKGKLFFIFALQNRNVWPSFKSH